MGRVNRASAGRGKERERERKRRNLQLLDGGRANDDDYGPQKGMRKDCVRLVHPMSCG